MKDTMLQSTTVNANYFSDLWLPNLKKALNTLVKIARGLRQVKPNEFHNRYSVDPSSSADYCQWNGGRLLSQKELKEWMSHQATNKTM